MKELILLEQFLLSRQATNLEHQQAIAWLKQIEAQLKKAEEQ